MQTHCPTCGRPRPIEFALFVESEQAIVVDGVRRRLGFVKWALLNLLRRNEGQWLPTERLMASLYGSSKNAPDSENVLRQHVHHLRKKLEGTGYRIESHTGRGSLGYRLERVGGQ